MKIKIFIMLLFVSICFGLTLNYMTDETIPLEPAQTAANRIEYRALMDSASYNIWQHKYKTANHDVADSATYYLTANDSCYGTADNLTQAIRWAISFYDYLTDHYAADSSHCGAADNVTVLPKLITVNATYAQFHNFMDSCLISMNNHFGRVSDTRYKILGKEAVADFIAHCAKDTSDTDSVHWTPDVTYNSVTFDSTNVDSVMAGWNRIKSRYNSHIAVAGTGGSDPHQSYTNADSVTAADATNLATLYDLISDYKTKYNQHIARTGTVHYTADTGTITGAALVKGTGHIEADTNTYTDNAYVNWSTWPFSYCLIQYTGSSVSTGASFYKYGSIDGKNYAYIDSTSVTADGAKMDSMAWFPWIRIMLNKRTDGTYKVDFKGAK